jgi:hypothetical protein
MPTNRLAQMQQDVGVPLPAGTQWELMQAHAQELEPVWEEFLCQAANGELFHNDDTTARILSLEKHIREAEASSTSDAKQRTGVFTTGIIAKRQERTFALFFSGGQHAGENLQALLDRRSPDLATPIQMCDGLSRNQPPIAATHMASCNAHGRRGFVTVADALPEECAHVLETMRDVYTYDEQTRREAMSDQQRLRFHQQHSGPLMDALKLWLEEKLDGRHVEPNGALGEAITYVLERWDRLTLFLHHPGAPLDNDICERLLKTSIRHRTNPFDYLTMLRRNLRRVRDDPAAWMPWNDRATAAARAGI